MTPKNNIKESNSFVSHLTPKEHAKIARLVGRRCTVKCVLNDIETSVLWDTGSQVSILSRERLKRQFPEKTLKNISELIDGELNLTAANGTKIPYIGWTEIEVRLNNSAKDDPVIVVPFLITDDCMEYPILGYNVIEELLKPGEAHKLSTTHLSAVKASFQNISEDALFELIRLIHANNSEKLCTVKSPKKDTIIPANRTIKIHCRANTGPVEETTPVLFEPDEMESWPDGLTVHETLTTVKQGSRSQIKIDVTNTVGNEELYERV